MLVTSKVTFDFSSSFFAEPTSQPGVNLCYNNNVIIIIYVITHLRTYTWRLIYITYYYETVPQHRNLVGIRCALLIVDCEMLKDPIVESTREENVMKIE